MVYYLLEEVIPKKKLVDNGQTDGLTTDAGFGQVR